MSRRQRRIWGAIAMAIIVAGGILWFAFASRHERFETVPTVVAKPSPVTSNERWTEIGKWLHAASSFDPNTNEPIVLYKNERTEQVLYALKGAIFFEETGRASGLTQTEDGSQPLVNLNGKKAIYWENGDHLLIGAALQPDNPESGLRGEWYSVRMQGEEDPIALRIEDAYQDPDSVLTVTVADDPSLFLLTIADDDLRYREFAYWPGNASLLPVNVEAGVDGDAAYERFVGQRPKPALEPQSFRRIASGEGGVGADESLRALEDERGVLVAAKWGSENEGVVRYPGYTAERLVWKEDVLGRRQPLVLLGNSGGSGGKILSFPFSGSLSVLEAAPELLDADWRMVDPRSFYTVGDGTVETIRFVWGDRHSSIEKRRFKTQGSLVEENKGLLTYEALPDTGNRRESLSAFDLLYGSGEMEERWLREPLTVVAMEGDRTARQIPTVKVKIPQKMWDLSWLNTEVPGKVHKAMKAADASAESCVFECDPDYGAVRQNRLIDGVWHVLQDKRLYRLEGDGLKLLGELPITLRTMIGEGANGYTAQDYVRVDGSWYVADTFADRVVRLTDSFEVAGILELPMPARIEAAGEGRLVITSLKGRTTVEAEKLRVIKQSPAVSLTVDGASSKQHEVDSSAYYEDPNTGNGWMTVYGNLFVYSKQEGRSKLLRHFIGYPESGRTTVKLLPYKQDILALSDNRLDRFSSDGQWKQTIGYTVGTKVCYRWPEGENSHVYDADRGQIFLVHGCTVIRIDLIKGTAEPVFFQLESRIGELYDYDGQIVFTVEGSAETDSLIPYPYSNELVALAKHSGKIVRYRLEKGWVSEGGRKAAGEPAVMKLGYRTYHGQNAPDDAQSATVDLSQINPR